MKRYHIFALFILGTLISSCGDNVVKSDAYGNFEATEVLISSEVQGKVLEVAVDEGDLITQGQNLVKIDSMQTYLTRKETESRIQSILSKLETLKSQKAILLQQKENINKDFVRVKNLLAGGASTQQKFDDLEGKMLVIDQQLKDLKAQQVTILAEKNIQESTIDRTNDLLARYNVYAPCNATVLVRYTEPGEQVNPGSPLLKVADLSELDLRVYISGNQLSSFKINQKVDVVYDSNKGLEHTTGVVSWISSEAEFTPKVVETREERLKLVYAMKIRVKNPNGIFKIGMPAEVNLSTKENDSDR